MLRPGRGQPPSHDPDRGCPNRDQAPRLAIIMVAIADPVPLRRALSSVRARLLWLVALAVFPAFALTSYGAWELRQSAVQLAQDDATRLARAISSAGERLVQDAVVHLEVLSQLDI